MKEEIERRILNKEDEIAKLNLDLNCYKQKLKKLTFDEFEIEDYVITLAMEMKRAKTRIRQLQIEVYELMQILKQDK